MSITYPPLTLITDPSFGDARLAHVIADVVAALPRGALAVQLRDKTRNRTSLRLFALELRRITAARGALLVVNGDSVVARDVGADGIHLAGVASVAADVGTSFRPRGLVTRAAHDEAELLRALRERADAVLVSPIYASRPSRLSGPGTEKRARGLAALRSARRVRRDLEMTGAATAIVALGGVGPCEAPACRAAGADGVAVIRSVLAASSPAATARAIHDAFAWR